MKKLFGFILSLLLITCNQRELDNKPDKEPDREPDREIICESPSKEENPTWLKVLIKKAETDKTGHYLGCIWLEKFKGQ
ncbi:MAG: hypothetical protein LBE79_09670, partial [Tannerella sp.]|nr:hypothetical protein [Tannerella sp.]